MAARIVKNKKIIIFDFPDIEYQIHLKCNINFLKNNNKIKKIK